MKQAIRENALSNMSGFRIYKKKHLNWMRPIFKNWIEFNERYQKIHVFKEPQDYDKYEDDSLFFLREQSAVGILASAAWSVNNGYAVQEVSATKKKKWDRRRKGHGREDLYIGKSEDWSKAIRLEAKLTRVNAYDRLEGRKNGTFKDAIYDTLILAKKQAKETYGKDGNLGGMAIIHFHAKKDPDSDDPICEIETVAKAVEKINKKVDAAAWYFDAKRRVMDKGQYYFGTALFISIVGRYSANG